MGSAEGRGREGGEEKGGNRDSFLMTCLVFQCLATCVIKLRNYFISYFPFISHDSPFGNCRMLLLPVLLSLSVPVPAQASPSPEIKGVHPSLSPKYVPTSSNLWSCLDGSRSIPWSAVNDDYCDCPDGSDEPGNTTLSRSIYLFNALILHLGTGACINSTFFCPNIGHVGASISATRVNDGLCGPSILSSAPAPSSSMIRT